MDVINLNGQVEWNGILVDMVPQGQIVKDVEFKLWSIQGEPGAHDTVSEVEDKLEAILNQC